MTDPLGAVVKLAMMMIMAVLIITMVTQMPELLSTLSEPMVERESDPEPAPPSDPVDWQPFVIGGGILLGAGGLGLLGFFGYKAHAANTRRKEDKKAEQEKHNKVAEDLKAIEERHNEVLVKYADYETDVWLALSYPVLHDVSEDKTRQFLQAMRSAETRKKKVSENRESAIQGHLRALKEEKGISVTLFSLYQNEVSALEDKFIAAEANAKKLQHSTLTTEEKKDIKSAQSLLKHVEDPANSEEARMSYYEQLSRVVKRLNERRGADLIPQSTVITLESQASNLLLTDGSENKAETVNIMRASENKETIR